MKKMHAFFYQISNTTQMISRKQVYLFVYYDIVHDLRPNETNKTLLVVAQKTNRVCWMMRNRGWSPNNEIHSSAQSYSNPDGLQSLHANHFGWYSPFFHIYLSVARIGIDPDCSRVGLPAGLAVRSTSRIVLIPMSLRVS